MSSAGNKSGNDALVPPGFIPNTAGDLDAKRSEIDPETKDESQRNALVNTGFLPKEFR